MRSLSRFPVAMADPVAHLRGQADARPSQLVRLGRERTLPYDLSKLVSRANAVHDTGHSVEVEQPLVSQNN